MSGAIWYKPATRMMPVIRLGDSRSERTVRGAFAFTLLLLMDDETVKVSANELNVRSQAEKVVHSV